MGPRANKRAGISGCSIQNAQRRVPDRTNPVQAISVAYLSSIHEPVATLAAQLFPLVCLALGTRRIKSLFRAVSDRP